MNYGRHAIAGIFMIAAFFMNSACAQELSNRQTPFTSFGQYFFCKHALNGQIYSRTELFFGLEKPNGSAVTADEFQYFVDTEVTPRFPDGLTLLTGQGQYKNFSGDIVDEGLKLLILFYPFSRESSQAIDEIRDAYKNAFQQESVLRVDEQTCISF